ncbi:23S rRNA-intervening sequence protein [Desulfobotulus alkaliphilus]|uniref:23S rRNA-intervening sequence protein n=1 Tax=Desulfobotulus alkaliphilus TaxID=622671 RepID=A0A562RTQ7_9BACT|nr:four helix bundle protein [Desulfobotulus alkaliphilus]TWI72448.1 23S rRNA-intervening sequence protein [Desulfobotulus alkaliphilus]
MKEDYPLYLHWYRTLEAILTAVESYPRSARFTMGDRTVVLAMAVMEDILEAIYTRNRGPILRKINLDLEKLRVFLRLARERTYLANGTWQRISDMVEEAGRMVGGWAKSGG